jgi:tripartite motif-containing protein 71
VIEGGANGFEICTPLTTDCRTGIGGAIAGGLSSPRGIAVDSGGDVYVADRSFDRIQKFASGGGWIRLWGEDVVGGGGTGFEVCTVAAQCKQGETVDPARGGELDDPVGVTADGAGNVYTSESSENQAGTRIQRFDSSGNWQRAWGADVIEGGGTGYEICTIGSQCKKGSGLLGEARIGGGLIIPLGVGADPAGNLYITDAHRIQKFAADAVAPPPPPSSSLPATPAPSGPTGQRAAALKKCKKKKSKRARKNCLKKARKLPV